MIIQRFDADSRAGADLSSFVVDDERGNDLRLDVHGHYVPPGAQVGGYAQVAAGYTSGAGRSNASVGNAEAGALFIPDFSTTSTLILHAGVALPTASDGPVNGLLRVHDGVVESPRALWARIGASPVYRASNLTLRLDAGLDLEVHGNPTTHVAALHLNVGVGIPLARGVFVAAELSSLTFLQDRSGGRFGAAAGLSLRIDCDRILPYAAVLSPLAANPNAHVGLILGAEARL